MSTVTVNSAETLKLALSSAQAGDTILLESGNYGNLQLKSLVFQGAVTIASKDPADPAVFTGLGLAYCEGLSFNNLELDFTSPWTVWNAQVNSSKNIEFNNVDMHGSLDGSPAADQSGLLIRSSSNVKVTGSEFQQLDHAISMTGSTGVRIEGNEFHDLRADGVVSAGTSSVQIVGNSFTDFYPVEGDHPDAIQFLTRGTTVSARDILISDNLINRGEGAITQGIFLTDQVGTLPYQNVTITNNVLVGTMYNGIAIANGANVTVGGNTVAALSDMKSFIQVLNVNGAVVTNNSAMQFNYTGTTNLTNTGNVVTIAALDGGSALIEAWLAAHDGVISGGSGGEPLPGGGTEIIAETIIGTSGDDRLVVDGTHDTRLEGLGGNDVLTGGGGANTLLGGAGNDTYVISDANDVVVEAAGAGTDVVNASVSYTLTDNVEMLNLVGGAAAGTGNALANQIVGNAGANVIQGLGGADNLSGGEGADTISGGADADRLSGDGGADRLQGGAGADTLTGGAGADVYFYTGEDVSGVDQIIGFSRSQGDKISLAGVDANLQAAGDQAFTFLGKGGFHKVAGELRYVVSDGSAHVWGDMNGDGVGDFHIVLVGVKNVGADDFIL